MKPKLINPNSISPDSLIELVAAELRSGMVVALATDTVFGLIGCVANCAALESIISIKGRDRSAPMPVIIGDRSQLSQLVLTDVSNDPNLSRIVDRFWPGPLTVILPVRKQSVCERFFPGSTVGIRFPNDSRLQAIAMRAGPVVATSANQHGRPVLTCGQDVMEILGSDANEMGLSLVVDENAKSELASTVIEVSSTDLHVLREGTISGHALAKVFGLAEQE
ncbi:MAG: L-threonylcarbamoyladenylate synthase [Acidimicrobiaceae bacterium]|nr:L-threonylcarbamoyladenylate synthase [Acidimicrobiaceae bacterium]